MDERQKFLNKNCKLVKKDGFVLYGKVIEIYNNGVFFQTDQFASYISWDSINSLVER